MVSAYTPHRHNGDTATLFSRPHPHSPSPSRPHLVRSPPSCGASAFTLSLAAAAKTRSASRRSIPFKSRHPSLEPESPIKFPLHLTTSSIINKSPRSMTRRSLSPSEKFAQRTGRMGGAFDDGGGRASSGRGSPLHRSEAIMNLDRASRGSPVAKRRSAALGSISVTSGRQPVFGSPSLGNGSASRPLTTPKRDGAHVSEDQTFVKPAPHAKREAGPATGPFDLTSRLRRVASQQTLVNPPRESPFNVRQSALTNASVHALNNHPHPLSQTIDSSQASVVSDLSTPQNFKLAKPNPAAFHSTGFVPKRGRHLATSGEGHAPQPDTPCKKNAKGVNAFSSFKALGPGPKMPIFGNLQAPGVDLAAGDSTGLRMDRRDSFASNDDSEESFDFGRDSQSSDSIDLPPTPTRRSAGPARRGYVDLFSGHKRLRTESSADGLGGRVRTPQTPANNIVPPDPSSLSISGNSRSNRHSVPATPSPDIFGHSRSFSSPFAQDSPIRFTRIFSSKFSRIELIGAGEFSEVYKAYEKQPIPQTPVTSESQLATPSQSSSVGSSSSFVTPGSPLRAFAVKKIKARISGPKDYDQKAEEAKILGALGKHDHVVEFVDSWVDDDDHLYIATEFCENGSLDRFLERHGEKGRLDEFRVWKVMLELCLGLEHIHKSGFLHLDLKPANILIAYDGTLKISDFGMALRYPAPPGIEREGDREYIAPEVIATNSYDRPVDIFSLGLTIIEAAGNEALPPNGPEWQRLRSGDVTVAPILSTSSSGEFVHRDENGDPVATELVDDTDCAASPSLSQNSGSLSRSRRAFSLLHEPRPGDLVYPPKFMEERGLEKIVQLMIAANPADRPTAVQLLARDELRWVDARRQSPATIFEGLWGPDDSVLELPDEEDWDMEL